MNVVHLLKTFITTKIIGNLCSQEIFLLLTICISVRQILLSHQGGIGISTQEEKEKCTGLV